MTSPNSQITPSTPKNSLFHYFTRIESSCHECQTDLVETKTNNKVEIMSQTLTSDDKPSLLKSNEDDKNSSLDVKQKTKRRSSGERARTENTSGPVVLQRVDSEDSVFPAQLKPRRCQEDTTGTSNTVDVISLESDEEAEISSSSQKENDQYYDTYDKSESNSVCVTNGNEDLSALKQQLTKVDCVTPELKTVKDKPMRRSARLEKLRSVDKETHFSPADLEDENSFLSRSEKRRRGHERKKEKEQESFIRSEVFKSNKKKGKRRNSEDFVTDISKKTPLKVAPLFFSAKKKKKSFIDEDDGVEIVEAKCPEKNTSMSEERRAFLQSGVPEILKQKLSNISITEASYPPLFSTSRYHNFSAEEEKLMEALFDPDKKFAISCTLKADEGEDVSCIIPKFIYSLSRLSDCDLHHQIEVQCVTKESLESIVNQVKNDLPNFPIKKYYNSLIVRKNEHNRLQTTSGVASEGIDVRYEHLAWTEKYGSSSGRGILGNGRSISKLKKWLEGWKQKTNVEETKDLNGKIKHSDKKLDKSSSAKCGDSSDDDFATSVRRRGVVSSDEDEVYLPCAYIIVGPHGCGKTALVYALAEQLNYKVFEVNASANRSGRQISQRLQEAMKSQHVSKDHLSSVFSTFQMMREAKNAQNDTKLIGTPSKKRKADAAANFFQPKMKRRKVEDDKPELSTPVSHRNRSSAHIETPTSSIKHSTPIIDPKCCSFSSGLKPPKKSVRKRVTRNSESDMSFSNSALDFDSDHERRKVKQRRSKQREKSSRVSDADIVEQNSFSTSATAVDEPKDSTEKSKGLNLASCSLILFDEVDVVFEEDKGLWSTIQMFIEVNKRPIILTCSNPKVADQWGPDTPICRLRKPSEDTLTGYLSAVCLAEKCFIPTSDVRSLARCFDNDVRRCLQWMHWQLAFSSKHMVIPSSGSRNNLEKDSCLSFLTAPLDHLTVRSRARPGSKGRDEAVDEDASETKSHDCSLLGVFTSEANEEPELDACPPPRRVPVGPDLSESEWPCVEGWSARCLSAATARLDVQSFAECLRAGEQLVTDSCDDSTRTDAGSFTPHPPPGEIADAVGCSSAAVSHAAFESLRSEVSESKDVCRRLLAAKEDQEINPLTSGSFARLLRSITDVLPASSHLTRRTVSTDYIPYLSHIAKSEEEKRLNLSKRRFFHYYDRIALDVEEDILELLYRDFS